MAAPRTDCALRSMIGVPQYTTPIASPQHDVGISDAAPPEMGGARPQQELTVNPAICARSPANVAHWMVLVVQIPMMTADAPRFAVCAVDARLFGALVSSVRRRARRVVSAADGYTRIHVWSTDYAPPRMVSALQQMTQTAQGRTDASATGTVEPRLGCASGVFREGHASTTTGRCRAYWSTDPLPGKTSVLVHCTGPAIFCPAKRGLSTPDRCTGPAILCRGNLSRARTTCSAA